MFPLIVALILLSLSLFNQCVLTQQNVPLCYFPNRQIAEGNYACNLSATVSSCCGMGSECLDNNICRNTNNQNIRGACTDRTWASPLCPQYCTNAATGGTDIISCENVTFSNLDYCCDHSNACCDTGVGRFRLSGPGIPYITLDSSALTATRHTLRSILVLRTTSSSQTATSTASTISSGSTTTTRSNSPSASLKSTPSSGLSTGAKAGIGAGVSVGAIIVVSLFGLWWKRSRRNPAPAKNDPDGGYVKPELDTSHTSRDPIPELPEQRIQELPSHTEWEVPGDSTWELPATGPR